MAASTSAVTRWMPRGLAARRISDRVQCISRRLTHSPPVSGGGKGGPLRNVPTPQAFRRALTKSPRSPQFPERLEWELRDLPNNLPRLPQHLIKLFQILP